MSKFRIIYIPIIIEGVNSYRSSGALSLTHIAIATIYNELLLFLTAMCVKTRLL
jgi:hypothetical protein